MALPTDIHPFHILGQNANQYKVSNSLRIRGSNSAYASRTFTTPTDQKKFTISVWAKLGNYSTGCILGACTNTSNNDAYFQISSKLILGSYQGAGTDYGIATAATLRDYSGWYHFVGVFDTANATAADRAILYINGVRQTVTNNSNGMFPLNHTCLLNSATTHNIGRRPTGNDNNFDGHLAEFYFIDGQALTPSSFGETDRNGVWVPKRYAGTYGTNGFYLPFNTPSLSTDLTNAAGTTLTAPFGGTANNAKVNDSVYVTSNTSTGSSFTFVQQDFGSTTQITRYSIGALYFTGGTSTFQLQYGNDPTWNSYTVGASLSVTGSGQNFSGSINGYARYVRLIPTAFGTNGQANVDYFIIYQDGIGLDASGNGNNWTPTNISMTSGVTYDSMIDSPTSYDDGDNGRGNYATLNPLHNKNSATLSAGNLQITNGSSGTWRFVPSTIGAKSGKFYVEMNQPTIVTNTYAAFFLLYEQYMTGAYPSSFLTGYSTQVGDTNTVIYSMAIDIDAGKVWVRRNGTWLAGDPNTGVAGGTFTPTGETVFVYIGCYDGSVQAVNFGQRPFAYTVPTGFKALNSYNLANPTIPLVG